MWMSCIALIIFIESISRRKVFFPHSWRKPKTHTQNSCHQLHSNSFTYANHFLSGLVIFSSYVYTLNTSSIFHAWCSHFLDDMHVFACYVCSFFSGSFTTFVPYLLSLFFTLSNISNNLVFLFRNGGFMKHHVNVSYMPSTIDIHSSFSYTLYFERI